MLSIDVSIFYRFYQAPLLSVITKFNAAEWKLNCINCAFNYNIRGENYLQRCLFEVLLRIERLRKHGNKKSDIRGSMSAVLVSLNYDFFTLVEKRTTIVHVYELET